MACADRPPRRHCSVVIRPCCRARRSSTERCCDERGVGTSSAPATDGCIGVRSPNGGQRRGRRPQARRTAVSPAGVVHRPAPRSSPHGSIFWLQKALIDCPFCPVASRSQPRQLQPGDQQRLALVSRGLVAGEQRTDPGRRCGRRGAPAPGAGHRVVMRVRRRHGRPALDLRVLAGLEDRLHVHLVRRAAASAARSAVRAGETRQAASVEPRSTEIVTRQPSTRCRAAGRRRRAPTRRVGGQSRHSRCGGPHAPPGCPPPARR